MKIDDIIRKFHPPRSFSTDIDNGDVNIKDSHVSVSRPGKRKFSSSTPHESHDGQQGDVNSNKRGNTFENGANPVTREENSYNSSSNDDSDDSSDSSGDTRTGK